MSNQDWHPADIVAAVRKLGTTLKDLSLQNGLPERACQVALHRPYTRPETVIAKALGYHPKEIWPSRYHANGERKRFLHSKIVAEKNQRDIKSSPCTISEETPKCLAANEG